MTENERPRGRRFGEQAAPPIDDNFAPGWPCCGKPTCTPRMPARTLWDFALENDRLYETELTISDLRWLVAKGFAEHGQETSFYGDPHRSFRPSRGLNFVPTTCFVLTPKGAEFASRVLKVPVAR